MPVCSRGRRPRQPTGPGRAPDRRLGSTPELGRAWRWFSRRRRGRSRAADVPRRCTSGGPVRPARHPVQCRSPPSPARPGRPPPARRTHRRDVPPPRRDGPRRRGSAARCRGRRRRRCRPTTRRPAATPPVPRCRRAVRPGQQIDDRAPHRPAGPPRHSPVPPSRRWCGPAVVLRPGHATSARSTGLPP